MSNSIAIRTTGVDRYLVCAPLIDGGVCVSTCVCSETLTSLGEVIHMLSFEEFNQHIMHGSLDIFSIRHALAEFRKMETPAANA